MSGENLRRVQLLLNVNYIHEHDAVKVLDYCRKELKWTDRQAVGKALLALGRELELGLPFEDVSEVSIKSDVIEMLQNLKGLAQRLASMDLSGAKMANGDSVDVDTIQRELNSLENSASRLVSDFHVRQDDDDDE